jgi:hypothetical protein
MKALLTAASPIKVEAVGYRGVVRSGQRADEVVASQRVTSVKLLAGIVHQVSCMVN